MIDIDDFVEIRECIYKSERYLVRDNGAIYRCKPADKRKRKNDEIWTFGIPNFKTAYMEFCGERVHRIVATAFHGEAPSNQHIVDHIDTNRQNNRKENLRWLTKLENILLNEITRKKVELICGSIEAFLENPSLLYGYEIEDKNFSWMKKVTPEEAKYCLENWTNWSKTASPNPNYKRNEHHIGEWIYEKKTNTSVGNITKKVEEQYDIPQIDVNVNNSSISPEISNVIDESIIEDTFLEIPDEADLGISEVNSEYVYDSLTKSAKQFDWKTPTEFPCCPEGIVDGGLHEYMEKLVEGHVFSSNIYDVYYVLDKAIREDKKDLIVLSGIKPDDDDVFGAYSLCLIKVVNDIFMHKSIKRFSNREEATRFFKIIIGELVATDDDYIMWDT